MRTCGHRLFIALCGLLIFLPGAATASVLADTPPPLILADDGFDWATGDDDDLVDLEDEFADETPEIADPIETVNRGIFWFNDKLYFYLLKPIARGLRYLPKPIRQGIDNVFTNISAPIRASNSLLQLKFRATGQEVARFLVNSTVGLFGLFDIAQHIDLPMSQEDFGQTLGHYGVGPGIYLVLPILGPSTLRDAAGETVDTFLDPLYIHTDTNRDLLAVKSIKTINALSLDQDSYEQVKRSAIDPYAFIKNTYIQHRIKLIEE